MKAALSVLAVLSLLAYPALPQQPPAPAASEAGSPASSADRQAEAYYHFSMGHSYEQLFESTARSEYASLAIEHFKKAYELDPASTVIGERLAEMYAKTQRIRDAVLEAQEVIRRDPNNLPARRLLARIYLRTLGSWSAAERQREIVRRAIEQYQEILRLDPADADAALWLARLYRTQNEHEKAEEVLRQLLTREPQNERALEQYAQLLLDLGRPEPVVERLANTAAALESPALLGLLGDAYAQLGQYDRAEAAFRDALQLDPRSIPLRRGLARTLLAGQKPDQALEQFLRLIELEPQEPEHHLRAAQIYREQNRLEEAEQHLLRARERAPGNLEVIYNEALLYEAQGRFQDAIRVLADAVVALKPQREQESVRRTLAVLYEQLGRLYRETDQFSTAVATFRELESLGEEEEKRALLLIPDTLRMARDLRLALTESRRALARFPNDPSFISSHALLLAEGGETKEAARLLRNLLGRAGDDYSIYLALTQVYERGRAFSEAEKAARQAEALSQTPAQRELVWFMLGAIYERQEKLQPAEEAFRKVLASNPRHALTLNYYGYMLAERGLRLEEAVALVRRALEQEPHNGFYLDSLGWAYFKLGQFEQAETYLTRAAERAPHNPTILDHLGDLYQQTGRHQLAVTFWEKALAEWQRALPSELEPEKISALERKLAELKRQLAQKSAERVQPR
ncbi:MAG: tetratricopeptide repeat protein [Acidobacteriia bacterium]|jgi:tetratricopeptide (TPR) repeat protein|nr:tetratricopeptide repeat protein [Terriglobia bacterium]